MPVPFRIGVMQLTMEPLDEVLSHARAMDRAGIDTIWLAEAYPWWRKHSMEARSTTALSPLIARETERLAIGWGIISPYSRHPVQIAMEARVTQEAAGPGRFYLGLGASKILMREIGVGERTKARPLSAVREATEIIRRTLAGEGFELEGREFTARVPALPNDAEAPRWPVPIYVAATGPKMLAVAGEVADGLLTASITTPDFVRYARDLMAQGAERAGRDPAEIDVQNIRGAADVLLEKAGLTFEEIAPVAEAMERGGRLAAKEAVTDDILEKVKPIAGTPAECVDRIREYREAGCTHIMLELWGEDRERQLELFGAEVLPKVKA